LAASASRSPSGLYAIAPLRTSLNPTSCNRNGALHSIEKYMVKLREKGESSIQNIA